MNNQNILRASRTKQYTVREYGPKVAVLAKVQSSTDENLYSPTTVSLVSAEIVSDYDLELTVDVDALLRSVGGRAALGKGGKTILQSGAVTIKRVGKREVSRTAPATRQLPKGFVLAEGVKTEKAGNTGASWGWVRIVS